jgi:hypothetical protein
MLLRTDLAGVEGKEAVIVVAEIAPGATTGKHLHAGQAFAYLLEGSLRLVLDGFRINCCGHQPPLLSAPLTGVHRVDLPSIPHESR